MTCTVVRAVGGSDPTSKCHNFPVTWGDGKTFDIRTKKYNKKRAERMVNCSFNPKPVHLHGHLLGI